MPCCSPRWNRTWWRAVKREVAKHFQCPLGSGEAITPDGAIVLADGTVIALDVTVVGSSDAAKEMIRRKTVGWGSLGALEKARRARADTWERVRRAVEDRTMGRRKAEEERQRAATLVQQAWSGGYKRARRYRGAERRWRGARSACPPRSEATI